MHRILVYQAILGVLLCPYECAVREVAARAPAEKSARSRCCQQCRIRQLAENEAPVKDRGPTDPNDPAEDGRSCLCEGAVTDATSRGPADSLLEASHWALAVDPAETPELTRPDWFAQHSGQPPPTGGGRQVRIAIQSFLL